MFTWTTELNIHSFVYVLHVRLQVSIYLFTVKCFKHPSENVWYISEHCITHISTMKDFPMGWVLIITLCPTH